MFSLREHTKRKTTRKKKAAAADLQYKGIGDKAVQHLMEKGLITMASTPYTERDYMLAHSPDMRARHEAEMRWRHEAAVRERQMLRARHAEDMFTPNQMFNVMTGEQLMPPTSYKSDEQVQAEVAVLLGEAPKAVATEAVPGEMDEYLRLAEQLGMADTKALANVKVRRVMQQLEIPHYPWDKVCGFLTKIQDVRRVRNSWGKPGVWAWLPVGPAPKENFGNREADGCFLGGTAYTKDVPLFAVRRAAQLQAALGKEKCAFYASELDIKVPDPFMVLRYGQADPVVFAHWDEPGFKLTEGEKEEKQDGEAA